MQFYKPADPRLFVGDCMPFSHNGTFYFYYLLDENHHQGLGGLGGHQWSLATSTDLTHWDHHPLALPITHPWEGSICTGSTLYHAGQFYAFYATRRRDFTQHLSLAVSPDGIHFEKIAPNPLFSPPAGYDPFHFRDPFAFHGPDGLIHLLVTALRQNQPIPERGGCLAHLVSSEPTAGWEMLEPFFFPGAPDVPECSDLFEWNGWYYLLYSSRLQAHYRLSRSPFGPWIRPPLDTFEAPAARVMKTAAWGSRRIGVAWIGSKAGERDAGEWVWGGQALFREVLQQPDGSLRVRPLEETRPLAVDGAVEFETHAVTPAVKLQAPLGRLARSSGLEALFTAPIPLNTRLRLILRPGAGSGPFGLRFRAAGFDSGYPLDIDPAESSLRLDGQEILGWRMGGETVAIDATLFGSILDVCVDGRFCLATRAYDHTGSALWLYALDRDLLVDQFSVEPLAAPAIG